MALSACEEVPAKTNWMHGARRTRAALGNVEAAFLYLLQLARVVVGTRIFLVVAAPLPRALGRSSAATQLYSNVLGFVVCI